ncbi:MAG: formyl transferase [Nitrospirae bacterium]|nr:formyl transferase [Nitrospirota bacterium]
MRSPSPKSGPTLVFLGLNGLGSRILGWLAEQGEQIACVLTRREQLPLLRRLRPDLVVSCGFRFLVPPKYLEMPPLGCINVHTSYLPHNRGTYTNAWSILDNTPAGVSIHKMVRRVDSGPIFARRRVAVEFSDTGKSLYEKLEAAGFDLFREHWPLIRSGEGNPLDVSSGEGTYHRDQEFWELMRIDLDRTYRGADLINRLRALTFPPYDNAFVEVNGKRYYLRLEVYEEYNR